MIFTVYVVTVIISAIIVTVACASEGKFQLTNTDDAWKFWGCLIVWPVFAFGILPYAAIRNHLQEKVKTAAERVLYKTKITTDRFDRSEILAVAEQDLKDVLKAFRWGLIELKKEQVEIIRDELMNRVAEKHLLK